MLNNFSIVFTGQNLTYTTSSYGKMVLIYKGYEYLRKSTYNDKIYWNCRHFKSFSCNVRIIQDLSPPRVTIKKTHTHDAPFKNN